MRNYRLSNTAREDLLRIYAYGVSSFGKAQAELYFEKLFTCFDYIKDAPFSFQAVDHIKQGYRRCVCGVSSIYYKVEKDGVDIIMIVGQEDVPSS